MVAHETFKLRLEGNSVRSASLSKVAPIYVRMDFLRSTGGRSDCGDFFNRHSCSQQLTFRDLELQERGWRKIAITLIMALRWALECNGLLASTLNSSVAKSEQL